MVLEKQININYYRRELIIEKLPCLCLCSRRKTPEHRVIFEVLTLLPFHFAYPCT
jgi:hypothetical protein